MAVILNIETSSKNCSVALTAEGMILTHLEDFDGRNHAALLSGFIKHCLDFAADKEIKLEAVAVSTGPGSYTGLRIGMAEAKGLCYALNIPLIGVDTLELLATRVMFSTLDIDPDTIFVPMVDARRMEVYAAVYDRSLHAVRETGADVVTPDTYREYLDRHPVYFFGNGAAKCMDVINHPNAHLIEGITPQAKWMFPLAERRMLSGQTEDVAYFVPYYLKDFVSKKPKSLL